VRLPLRNLTRRQLLKLSLLAAAGTACAYPWLVSHRLVRTTHRRLPVPRLPEAFRGFTIVQVTDLHMRALGEASFLQGIIDRANALKPDLIVVTGDYVHGRGTEETVDCVWDLLAGLEAPAGVHVILGNHDYGLEDQAKEHLKKSGRSLHNTVCPVRRDGQTLWLAGAGDFWRERLPLDPVLARIPKQDCRLVLAHNPDTADSVENEQVDLFITGHTHGGQVYIPFVGTPVLPVRNKTYSSGLKPSRRGENVFICRGIGWSILPVRFLCPPELAVLELVPAPAQEASA
jgi:predicted MPP superfamily phosphohydrolase